MSRTNQKPYFVITPSACSCAFFRLLLSGHKDIIFVEGFAVSPRQTTERNAPVKNQLIFEYIVVSVLVAISVCGCRQRIDAQATGPKDVGLVEAVTPTPEAGVEQIDTPAEEPAVETPPPAQETDSVRNPGKWELDPAAVTDHRGTGGLNPTGMTLAFVHSRAVATHGYVPPKSSLQHNKGFYFTGPGKILPECALRIYRKEQCANLSGVTSEFWSGPEDCSALAWVVRTDEGFLIRIQVTDDKHVTGDKQPHLNDSVELYFDVRDADRGVHYYERGVFQLLLAPNRESGEVTFSYSNDEAVVPGAKAVCVFRGSSYELKIFIPFEGLKEAHHVPGSPFNFDIGINDADEPGKRDTQMMWAGSFANFMDARCFGWMRAVRRGVYFTSAKPPQEALLKIDSQAQFAGGGSGRGWTGPDDSSAVASLRRGADGFTVTVDVTDDKIHLAHELPWENDGVELFFDLRPDATRGKADYDKGVLQVIFNPSKAGGPAAVHYGSETQQVPGLKATSQITPTGYRIEAFFPFEGLKVNHVLPGEFFNFDVMIDDSDSPEGRDTIHCWAGFHRNYCNTASFGRMAPVGKQQ